MDNIHQGPVAAPAVSAPPMQSEIIQREELPQEYDPELVEQQQAAVLEQTLGWIPDPPPSYTEYPTILQVKTVHNICCSHH